MSAAALCQPPPPPPRDPPASSPTGGCSPRPDHACFTRMSMRMMVMMMSTSLVSASIEACWAGRSAR
eukprot:1580565-Rhodomonas_salina.1